MIVFGALAQSNG